MASPDEDPLELGEAAPPDMPDCPADWLVRFALLALNVAKSAGDSGRQLARVANTTDEKRMTNFMGLP